MTVHKRKVKLGSVEALTGDRDLVRALVKEALQEILEAERCIQHACRVTAAWRAP